MAAASGSSGRRKGIAGPQSYQDPLRAIVGRRLLILLHYFQLAGGHRLPGAKSLQ
jgi:hypothetical protein